MPFNLKAGFGPFGGMQVLVLLRLGLELLLQVQGSVFCCFGLHASGSQDASDLNAWGVNVLKTYGW